MDAQTKTDTRNYGIDLLRIVSMFMVCFLHILGTGGILDTAAPLSASYTVGWLLESLTYCAVNCYALISGYVGIKSKHKYAGIAGLWLQVAFYSILITLIFLYFRPETVSMVEIKRALFPVFLKQYWYFTAYFCLFFFAPMFNHAVVSMSKNQLRNLLVVLFVSFTILPRLLENDTFSLLDGYSFVWLAYLYVVGGYIRVHHAERKPKPLLCLGIFLLCCVLSWLWKIGTELAVTRQLPIIQRPMLLISYTSPTMTVAAIALFLLFANLNIKKGKRLIRFFSPFSFAVYLIHTHPYIFAYVLSGAFAFAAAKSAPIMVAIVFLGALGIYLLCSLVDWLRDQIFKLLRIQKGLSWLENKFIKQ